MANGVKGELPMYKNKEELIKMSLMEIAEHVDRLESTDENAKINSIEYIEWCEGDLLDALDEKQIDDADFDTALSVVKGNGIFKGKKEIESMTLESIAAYINILEADGELDKAETDETYRYLKWKSMVNSIVVQKGINPEDPDEFWFQYRHCV